jgi:hypothetical protein
MAASCSCASSSVQKNDLTSLLTIPESSITPILNVLPIHWQLFYDINGHEPFVYILSERTSMVRPGYKKTVVRVLDMLSKSVIRTIDIEIQNIFKMHFCGSKYIIFHICEEEDDFYNKRDSFYIFEKTTFEFKYKIQFDYGEEFVLNISPNGKYFTLYEDKELRLYSPEHGFISIMKIENSIFSDIDGFSRFEQICWKYDDSEFLILENQTLVVYTINMPEPDTESESDNSELEHKIELNDLVAQNSFADDDFKTQTDKIIKSFLGKYRFRTAKNISKELNYSITIVEVTLEQLQKNGITKKFTTKNNVVLWGLTKIGTTMAEKPMST